MSEPATVHVGPRLAEEGIELTIIRTFLSESDVHEATFTTVKYVCHGVEEIDVQDPWQMGSLEPSSVIGVHFVNGHREYINGVVKEFEVNDR